MLFKTRPNIQTELCVLMQLIYLLNGFEPEGSGDGLPVNKAKLDATCSLVRNIKQASQ